MIFKLRELEWRLDNRRMLAQGINHEYAIDETSEGYRIAWHDQINQTHNSRYFPSALEAMRWAQETHYPAQIEPWVIKIKED